jgi:hypothetical protein
MRGKWDRLRKKAREEWLQDISRYIVKTCELIAKKYNDDPDKLLLVSNGKLNPPLLYFIFRQLPGIGPKKASMLSRDFTWNKDSYLEYCFAIALGDIWDTVNQPLPISARILLRIFLILQTCSV